MRVSRTLGLGRLREVCFLQSLPKEFQGDKSPPTSGAAVGTLSQPLQLMTHNFEGHVGEDRALSTCWGLFSTSSLQNLYLTSRQHDKNWF